MRNQEEVAKIIVSAFYSVYNALGYGFLEKVYENALSMELRGRGLFVQSQHPIAVYFKDQQVGEYFADLLVENCVIVEIKATEYLIPEYDAQILNYLKATDIDLGLLVHFGPIPKVKRKIFETARGK